MEIWRGTWSTTESRCSFIRTTMPLCAKYSPPLYKTRRKIGFIPSHHDPFRVLMIFPWFSPKNTRLTTRWRKSLTTCSMWRRTPNESFRNYVKRFKAKKAKIVGCDDSIASATFQKELPSKPSTVWGNDHERGYLTLAGSFALAEKHALWDEARPADKAPEQPRKESAVAQKNEDGKQSNKSRHDAKLRDRPTTKEGLTTKNYSKFSILIYQILRDIKNEPWFKLLKQWKRDTSKLDHTKYYAFHLGL